MWKVTNGIFYTDSRLICLRDIAVPDLVGYVFKAAYFARKDLVVPQLSRKRYSSCANHQLKLAYLSSTNAKTIQNTKLYFASVL